MRTTQLAKQAADRDPLVGMLRWRAPLLYHDPLAFDRWLWIRRNASPGPLRTLDAGSGNAAFAMYAAERGNEVTALSYSHADQAKAKRRAGAIGLDGIRFEVRDLRELDDYAEELGQYDQVICLEVIEHILDDRKLLRDFASAMRPGARLLLTTPYRDHVPFFGEVISEREDGHHLRKGYTHEEMADLLAEAGLRLVSADFLSGVVSQRLFNVMYRFDSVYPHLGWALTLPLRLLRPLDGPLTRMLSYPPLAIGVVAIRD